MQTQQRVKVFVLGLHCRALGGRQILALSYFPEHLKYVLAQPDRIGRKAAGTPAITREYVSMISNAATAFDHAQPQIEIFNTAQRLIKHTRTYNRLLASDRTV